MPFEASMIPLKLKRKLRYKGLYNYVRPDKVMIALKWLKENNPLYSNINPLYSNINSWINDVLITNSDFVRPHVDNNDNNCRQ